MKRWICCILPLMLCLGCAPGEAPKQAPGPRPEPAEAPKLRLLMSAPLAAASFWDGAAEAAAELGAVLVPLTRWDGADRLTKSSGDALLVYLAEEDADTAPLSRAAGSGLPVVAFCPTGAVDAPGVHALCYDPAGAAEAALEAALACEPHEAPVRLLGLFADGDGPARAAWEGALAQGRIMDRGVYVANQKQTAEEFLFKRLDACPPGTLDGVFAQTQALALAAGEALHRDGRAKAEVFCAEGGEGMLYAMLTRPALYYACAGPNEMLAGRLLTQRAAALAQGEEAPMSSTLFCTLFASGQIQRDWDSLWMAG